MTARKSLTRSGRGMSPIRARQRAFTIALGVSSCFLLVSCGLFGGGSRQIFVPKLDTARQQYEFAERQHNLRLIKPENEELARTRLEEVRAAYDMVITRFPDDRHYTPTAKLQLAKLYNDHADHEMAIEIADQALQDYSDIPYVDARARYERGKALNGLGRVIEAQEVFKETVDLYEDSEDPMVKLLVRWSRTRYERLITIEP